MRDGSAWIRVNGRDERRDGVERGVTAGSHGRETRRRDDAGLRRADSADTSGKSGQIPEDKRGGRGAEGRVWVGVAGKQERNVRYVLTVSRLPWGRHGLP
jgi:hypothetical protein